MMMMMMMIVNNTADTEKQYCKPYIKQGELYAGQFVGALGIVTNIFRKLIEKRATRAGIGMLDERAVYRCISWLFLSSKLYWLKGKGFFI